LLMLTPRNSTSGAGDALPAAAAAAAAAAAFGAVAFMLMAPALQPVMVRSCRTMPDDLRQCGGAVGKSVQACEAPCMAPTTSATRSFKWKGSCKMMPVDLCRCIKQSKQACQPLLPTNCMAPTMSVAQCCAMYEVLQVDA
jgi:hypothetical protein